MGEHRDRMGSGDWYRDGPELQEERRACARRLERFNATGVDQDAERAALLGELLAAIGPGTGVMPRFVCSYGSQITLGADVLVNYDCLFMDDASITVADDVLIGPRTQLLTAWHPVEDHQARRERWERTGPITLGDNCWLAAGVIVGPGVTIGRDAVVGAGSVVVRDVPDRVLVAGNPARVVRSL